ncbi:radical SAM protein [Dehalogenimonas sp. 4OHTPN]|uniref:Radical SAM protein n=1 Tax=Dehalogenimonas sp. 4OHTPN TaxID=3166643 RepID=A0AAU8GB19_9CHLR
MNLVLIRECSNSCPYCFEAAEREDRKQGLISMDNIGLFAKWARASRLPYLSLLGGEPFLHPKLPDIVKIFRQQCPGTSLRILTGGVFNKDILDNLSPEDAALVFNVNEPGDYRNPKHFTKVINNVENAMRKGFKVSIGFNVWRLDFDPTFIPSLTHRLGLGHFTWTVANPIKGCESKIVPATDFGLLSDRCFSMLQEAARLGVEGTLDCPLPLCFFSDSQLAWVRQFHPETTSGMGPCDPVLDVTPELEVIRCFALSKASRIKLMDYPSEEALEEWFRKHLDQTMMHGGCYSACIECVHFKKGRCNGGCLAWHPDPDEEQKTSLEVRMYRAIEAGTPQAAVEMFNCASLLEKTDMAAFAAAVAASQLGDWDAAFRYAYFANARARNPEFMRRVGAFIEGIPVKVQISPSQATEILSDQFVTCSAFNHSDTQADNS